MTEDASALKNALLSIAKDAKPVSEAELERQLCVAARLLGVDKEPLIADFRRNGPLAQLIRAAFHSPKKRGKRKPNAEKRSQIAQAFYTRFHSGLNHKQALEAARLDLELLGRHITVEGIDREIRRRGISYFFG